MLLLSSVVRGSQQGETHGGLFLLDLEQQRSKQVINWNVAGIDWQGHGGDRGLRGIAFDDERVYIAASDALFVFSPTFELLGSFRSPYLRYCHAIRRFERKLYLISAGYDSVLAFDLDQQQFDWGMQLVGDASGLEGRPFDPQGVLGPPPGSALHLNSVWCDQRGMFLGGQQTLGLWHFNGRRVKRLVTLPQGVCDARPWRDGVLFNDAAADRVRFITPDQNQVFQVPHYPPEVLEQAECAALKVARQGFARGLCVIGDSTFAAGSSPLTVTLHDLASMKTTLSINLDRDVRHAIHTIEVWPFGAQQ